ncbi:MAG: hypothetical protein LBH79_07270 [Nitrososphaerota archaeon]|jgi:hypothetical protein|nr:hypothetical protein [Nitrososphaerota archaeon]
MTNEPRALKEIHDVRLRIYEKTKDFTPQQRAELTGKTVREFEKESGITFRRLEITSVQRKAVLQIAAET